MRIRRRAFIVSRWFVFDGTPGSKFASATLTYGPAPKRFGRVIGVKQPFLENAPIPRAPLGGRPVNSAGTGACG